MSGLANPTAQRAALVAMAAVSALNETLQMLTKLKGQLAMVHVDFGGHPAVLTSDMDEVELTEKLSEMVIASFGLAVIEASDGDASS